jgi:HlyD family secretion protein
MKAKWILTSIILAVILTGCCTEPLEGPMSATPSDAEDTPQPTLPPPLAGRAVIADGQLESPYPSLALGFGGGASGRVATIEVKAGDAVEAGNLLAVLDDSELQRAVDEAQLALDRAVADREQALAQWERDVGDAEETLADAERALTVARLKHSETSVEEARVNLKWAQRAESDRKEEYEKAMTFWPPIPVDSYRAAWHRAVDDRELAEMRLADAENAHQADGLDLGTLQGDVAEAERALAALEEGVDPSHERAVEDAEMELVRTQEDLERASLEAPWAGIVLSVDVAPEAAVTADTPVATLLDVEDGLRFVTQNLSEQHVADIYLGQRAVVTLRTFAETPLEGTVEAVVPQEEVAESDARFTVHVRLAPTGLRLLPGLTGRVEILAGD